ncbi:MAG: hypothetical protein U1A25_01155 [Candidatus Sungbacteria bacterium]|nr:hypothetical protein [bacterium]MDZ4260247.1 hypothetical protein [Candidatus Sungbacteria bacterium]
MLKYFILVCAFIAAGLAGIYVIGLSNVYREVPVAAQIPHVYDNSAQSIEDINIVAFYVVPKNKVAVQIDNWKEILQENLEKLQAFHNAQFKSASHIRVFIYPEPVIGRKDNLAYDTDITQHGNPSALLEISQELKERAFDSAGDLYKTDLASFVAKGWHVSYILYEGVGAAGTEHAAIMSRTFFTDPQYRIRGTSYMVHEFYHTIGIPDGYNLVTAVPTTDDIMGLGRERAIEYTYLAGSTLKSMGLLQK